MTFGLSMIWSSFVIDSCALNTTRQNLPRAAHAADAAGAARAFANVKARFHRWILASSFEYKNNLRSVMGLANLIAIRNDVTVGVRLQQW